MIKKLLFTAALLVPGLAYGVNPSANLSVQVVPAGATSNVCTGSSPDPQAATDGFTSPAFCIDFTQATLPSNWLRCPNDGAPGYLLYGGWPFGNGFPGCQYITHEVDPATGQMALRLAYPTSVSSDYTTSSGLLVITAANEAPTAPGNKFGQGWFQAKFRAATNPKPPSPQNITPGVVTAFYGSTRNPTVEFDVQENWTFFGDCPDMGTLDWTHTVREGAMYGGTWPCAPAIDSSQYHTFAMRVTGDGVSTRGYTAYIDGSVAGSYFSNYPVSNTPDHSAWEIWNSPFSCVFGFAPCNNVSITGVSNCAGLTCVTLSQPVFISTGQPAPNCGANPVYIQGTTGIPGLNGLHNGQCASNNPTTNVTLTGFPWPGGTYGGGGMWNPLIQSDVWVQSIAFWACPGFDPTVSPPNTRCNSPTALAGAP
jgi:hypothetical protein